MCKTAAAMKPIVRVVAVAALAALSLLASSILAHASPATWRSEGWTRTDFSRTTIDLAEIISGGPPKDGIPSIDDPAFKSVDRVEDLAPQEPVIGLEINGDARAYPLRLLIWHEIANDVVGGVPVAVTYCPLCNAAIVFDRRNDGSTLTFGTTGKLRRSDLVMYDRQTETLWQQFTGEAIVGTLTGRKLQIIPSRLESFALFKMRHPLGKVLIPVDDARRTYGRNPYEGYDSSAVPFLYRGDYPQGINPMERVEAVRDGKRAHAVSLKLLRSHAKIEIGGYPISWQAGQSSALDQATIAGGRDVGNVLVKRLADGGLEDVPYDGTFAFVFHAFHPDVTIDKTCKLVPNGTAPAWNPTISG